MSGTALIVDSVSTNRIICKAKLTAAFYRVFQAETGRAALEIVAKKKPDIVVLKDNLPDITATALCRKLKNPAISEWTPVVIFFRSETNSSRIKALQAGADDVLTHPMGSSLTLARLRGLMRVRDAAHELDLRDETAQALGFAETGARFENASRQAIVTIISNHYDNSKKLIVGLDNNAPYKLEHLTPGDLMIKREKVTQPDVHVINLSALDPERGMSLLTDLKSHTKTRLAATVVLIPKDYQNLAAYVLDIGANDVMIEPIDTDELNIRLVRLIERKRIGDELRTNIRSGLKAAITDPLTGLYNRRYAIPHMERMLMQAQENGRSCAIMVADLDHLKQINDQYGHAAGDTVLVEVSRRLNTNLRAIDLVARMGGEEFLIIMPETKQGEAETAGKRLCNLIHDTPIELANGKCQVSVSISIGVALGGGSNDPRQSAAQVLDLADRALYGSKSEGRNRVTLTDHAA